MFGDLRDWLQRRAGYRDAAREIADLCEGLYPDDEILARRSITLNRRPRSMGDPYVEGWARRWTEFGAEDARLGRCQLERFDYYPYALGWAEQIAERHKYGWRHPKLDVRWEKLRPNERQHKR